MIAEAKPSTVELSDTQFKKLSSLLLNSWSAEYALRLTPIVHDDEYLRTAKGWIFPQAYYAPLFSFKAVVYALSPCITDLVVSEELIAEHVDEAFTNGFYGKTTLERGFFTELTKHKINANAIPAIVEKPVEAHAELIKTVHTIAAVHESFILYKIGVDQYKRLVDSMPDYLLNAFLMDRTQMIYHLIKIKFPVSEMYNNVEPIA